MADRVSGVGPGADVLARAIVAQAEEEAAKIRDAARAEAERIIAQAKAEAGERRAGASREEMDRVRKETATTIALARFEARRGLLDARDELIEKVFAGLAKALDALRKDSSYARLLAALVREALDALDGDRFIVALAPGDKAVAEAVLSEAPAKQLDIEADPDVHGGCVVWQADRRAYYDNSFTAIVAREKPRLRSLVAEWLWGTEQTWLES